MKRKKKKFRSNKKIIFSLSIILSLVLVAFGYSFASSGLQKNQIISSRVKKLQSETTSDKISQEIQEAAKQDPTPVTQTENDGSGLIQEADAASSKCGVVSNSFKQSDYDVQVDTGATRYSQADSSWGKTKYGSKSYCSTYSVGGCAPSSLASALTAWEIYKTPADIGAAISKNYPQYRDKYTKSSPCASGTDKSAIKIAPGMYKSFGYKLLGEPVNWATAKKYLTKDDYPVIVRTTNPCFTSGAHYLVIKGIVKKKSNGAIYYWLADSSSKDRVLATEAEITKKASNYWSVGIW